MRNQARRTEYQREKRASDPAYRERQRLVVEARRRALEKLARLHPNTFSVLVDEARGERGLPPVGAVPLGRPPKAPVPTSPT